MNIGDLLSKKIVQILIALLIGATILIYRFDLMEVILPKKTTIKAIDQNNSDIKIYDDTIVNEALVDSLAAVDNNDTKGLED